MIGCRTHASKLTGNQQWFEDVRSIHGAARCGAGTDNRMNFIDEEDGIFIFLQFIDHRFEPLFKITAVFCAGQQRTHIKGVDCAILQQLRNFIVHNSLGQTFCNRGFSNSCIADQKRVVLATTTQYLHGSLDLLDSTNQRIDFPPDSPIIQILCVKGKGILAIFGLFAGNI